MTLIVGTRCFVTLVGIGLPDFAGLFGLAGEPDAFAGDPDALAGEDDVGFGTIAND